MNMVKELPFRMNQCFGPFNMLQAMGHLQLDFLNIYLTTFFGVSNFGKIRAIKVIYFEKSSKFDVYLKNAHKDSEKVFFCHKCI